jgi:hypothetical protein
MAAKGFARARQRFDLARTVAELEQLYGEVLSGKAGNGHADRH